MAWVSERFVLNLRSRAVRPPAPAVVQFLRAERTRDILSRITGDITATEELVLSGVADALTFTFELAFFTGALFFLDWRLVGIGDRRAGIPARCPVLLPPDQGRIPGETAPGGLHHDITGPTAASHDGYRCSHTGHCTQRIEYPPTSRPGYALIRSASGHARGARHRQQLWPAPDIPASSGRSKDTARERSSRRPSGPWVEAVPAAPAGSRPARWSARQPGGTTFASAVPQPARQPTPAVRLELRLLQDRRHQVGAPQVASQHSRRAPRDHAASPRGRG